MIKRTELKKRLPPEELKERNECIFEEWKSGKPIYSIMAEYKISHALLYKIINQVFKLKEFNAK